MNRMIKAQLMRPKTNFSGYSCLKLRLNVLFRAVAGGGWTHYLLSGGESSICIAHPGEYPHNQRNNVCLSVCVDAPD